MPIFEKDHHWVLKLYLNCKQPKVVQVNSKMAYRNWTAEKIRVSVVLDICNNNQMRKTFHY